MTQQQIKRRLEWLKKNRFTLADIAELIELEALLEKTNE